MTTKANREGKRGGAVRKGSKLALSKRTLADLTPGKSKERAVRGGGIRTGTCR